MPTAAPITSPTNGPKYGIILVTPTIIANNGVYGAPIIISPKNANTPIMAESIALVPIYLPIIS